MCIPVLALLHLNNYYLASHSRARDGHPLFNINMKGSYSNIRLRRIAFVGVIFVLPCIHFLRSSLESHDSITINDGNSTTDDHKHKLADGCYHVFLDVGSNIGMHVRFLLEPHKYPKAKIAR